MNAWLDTAAQTFMVGLSAFVWIVVAKILAAQYGEWIPTPIRDLIALV